jgi:predicted DNA-binding protein (UPF0251 family)/DNA-directed RNA polymerase subunit RPC12/RpoP
MSRPKNNRVVHQPPVFTEFKPSGIKGKDLATIIMTIDEYEAIRLADKLGYTHEEASEEMDISRSTFTRLLDKARLKTAELIIDGKRIIIEGGNIHFRKNILKCNDCGTLFETKIGENVKDCPNCNKKNLINLAVNFGQGKYCVK